jgi:DNA-binding XRE family transcriptional regulator
MNKTKMLKLMYKRKELGLTQEELGSKVGVIGKTIHHYEVGLRQPTADMLKKLATVLNCTIDEIV